MIMEGKMTPIKNFATLGDIVGNIDKSMLKAREASFNNSISETLRFVRHKYQWTTFFESIRVRLGIDTPQSLLRFHGTRICKE